MMATYVFVHGGNMSSDTWNRIAGRNDYPPGWRLGGRIWDGTAKFLREEGHRVYAPTLGDEHATTLTGHIEEIFRLVTRQDLRDVILVGHSYSGMVITGVAAMVPRRIRRLVYLDAAVPSPGQSLFDIIASGGRDPLSFAGLEPALVPTPTTVAARSNVRVH